jgi:hypothetical protein
MNWLVAGKHEGYSGLVSALDTCHTSDTSSARDRSPTQRNLLLLSISCCGLAWNLCLVVWQTACTVHKQEKAMSRKTTMQEQIETYGFPGNRKLFRILIVY